MAIPAEAIAARTLKHREKKRIRHPGTGKLYEYTSKGHLREVDEKAEASTAASTPQSSSPTPPTPAAAEPEQNWPASVFLFAGSGITLWLLLSGHAKAAAQALGWAKLPKAKSKATPKGTHK